MERIIKIKNNSKEALQEEFLSIIHNNADKTYKNKKLSMIGLYDPIYNEKNKTVILKKMGEPYLKVFDNSDCKKLYNKNCNCNHVYTCNGYYIFCTECGLRQHEGDILFSFNENIRQAFVNYGIINNTININNTLPSLTKYDVMKKYPISIDLFKNKKEQELFIKVLEHHNYEDIVKYFEYNNTKYRYYKDNTIYNNNNELLSEMQFYTLFKSFWSEQLSKIIKFFEECKEHPLIDNICHNKHIIFNMNVLKEVLNDKSDNLIKYLYDIYIIQMN